MAEERKTEFAGSGVIKKCPNCGAQIEAFQMRCPACGFEIRGEYEGGSVALKNFLSKYKKADSEWRKADIVNTFPLPNTVEDIFEFTLFASQQIKTISQQSVFSDADKELCNALSAKIEEARIRADLFLQKDDPRRASFEMLIANSMKNVDLFNKTAVKEKKKDTRDIILGMLLWIFIFVGIPIGIPVSCILGIKSAGPRKIKAETTRLEKLTTEIQSYIAEGNYDMAELKMPDVRWTYTNADDREEFETIWNNKQQTLKKQLEEVKKGKK